ncbi:MAG: DUF3850 domain-containing protein [Planctomycetales bacterium]|nr:DUF3850 domain-containing protein [Planctomycetales bacterium]
MVHELKCWPDHFQAIASKAKTAEVRMNDRNFQVYDTLELWEYLPTIKEYTGRRYTATITHILHGGQFGIQPGFCVISFQNGKLTRKSS